MISVFPFHFAHWPQPTRPVQLILARSGSLPHWRAATASHRAHLSPCHFPCKPLAAGTQEQLENGSSGRLPRRWSTAWLGNHHHHLGQKTESCVFVEPQTQKALIYQSRRDMFGCGRTHAKWLIISTSVNTGTLVLSPRWFAGATRCGAVWKRRICRLFPHVK